MSGSVTVFLWLFLLFLKCSPIYSMHELCTKSRQNLDCSSSILPYDKTNNCTIKFYENNSTECSQLDFNIKVEEHSYLGDITIVPYIWDYRNEHHYIYTLYNITFSNIKWKHMKFRFTAEDDDSNDKYKNHCREISLENVSPLSVPHLNYDCHWSDQDLRYQNRTFYFEFLAEDGAKQHYGKYLIFVPPVDVIKSMNTQSPYYIYINLTKLPDLYLHSILPSDDNQSYTIDICKIIDGVSNNCKKLTNVNKNQSIALYRPKKSGLFYFQLYSQDCNTTKCYVLSPKISINKENIVFTILWNVALVLIISAIIFLVLHTFLRLRRNYSPNVLMIFSHIDKQHGYMIKMLHKYMQSELHWNVMWDEEIELTDHGDPYLWCLDAFMKADCVLYFIRPEHCCNLNIEIEHVNIHVNLEDIFLKVVKTAKLKKNVDVFNIVLDNKVAKVPSELEKCRNFYLMRDWNSLIHSMLRNTLLEKLKKRLPKLERSELGRNVLDAFENHKL